MVSNSDAQCVVQIEDAITHPGSSSGPIPRLGPWTLEVRRGEFLVLLGPRSCGKTSLIKVLAGLLPLAGGSLQCAEPFPGLVFGVPSLLPWRTLLENVMLGAELRKIADAAAKERARLLLGSLGIAEYEQIRGPRLPPGAAERAAICRALVHKPVLLLMDDPFRHLDPLTRERLWLDLQRLWADEGFGAVLATTEIAEAVHLADRVAVMGESPGEIVQTVPVGLARPRRMSKAMTPLLAECGNTLRTILRAQGALT